MPVRGSAAPATIFLVCTTRDRPRQLLTRAFPRGRTQLHVVRDADALDDALQTMLVDAIIVDLLPGAASRVGWRALDHATRHAPMPTVGLVAPRALDVTLLTRLHASGVASVLVDGVDDAILRTLLHPVLLTTRFTLRADMLLDSHEVGELAQAVWRTAVSHAGRLTSVATVAKYLGMSREHLSRSLKAAGSPGLKQLLELVRLLMVQMLLSAGIPVALAASRLGYSSASHLARAARAATGSTPRQWNELQGDDLITAAVSRGRARPSAIESLPCATPSLS